MINDLEKRESPYTEGSPFNNCVTDIDSEASRGTRPLMSDELDKKILAELKPESN
jgi:hypothetical protein